MAGSRSAERPPPPPPAPRRLSDRDFRRLGAFIEERFGIRMPPAKRVLLESRLARRVSELGLPGFAEYCELVLGVGAVDELEHLVDRVTTNKTDFFREPQHFEVLVKKVLPLLTEHGVGTRRPLRVWSAACSTGEEPYTLAMVLAEQPGLRFDILATDLSVRVLRHAEAGIYREAAVQPIPLELRRRYLLRSIAEPDQVRVRRELREAVRFRRLNLLDADYELGPPLDVIFCRNVFIYFERSTQAEILRRLAQHLAPGGFLFLGHSESINGLAVPFEAIAPSAYRRRERP